MKPTQPKQQPKTETIFETEKRLKQKAPVVLAKVKETDAEKLKNGWHWVNIDAKTRVLRKIKK